jgi:carboxyl-terminal processing protease
MSERRSSFLLAFLPTLLVTFALGGGFAGYVVGRKSRGPSDLAKLQTAVQRIEERYYGNLTREQIVDGAIEGMVAKLDPYSEYFTVQEWKEFEDVTLRGKFGGVGIVVGLDRETGWLTVETPVEESPAFEQDILPGDQIREVDGKTVKGLPLQDVVKRIKGEPGTQVTLTLLRKGRDPFKVTMTRKIITVKAVKARMLDGGTGYVRISDFTEMMEQFDQELEKLQKQGLQALVVDLRFNGGGLLHECVKLADRFLDEGVIVSTQGRTGDDRRSLKAERGNTLPPIPLAVLVNEGTASASEIFAGAMKDHKRGAIVGARTFGKGSVQTPFPLPDGSNLKITTARYFTPLGTSVHREEGKKEYGIDPDYRVEMSQEEYEKLKKKWSDERILKGEKPREPDGFVDPQMDAALEVLKAKLEKRDPKVQARILQKDKPSEN